MDKYVEIFYRYIGNMVVEEKEIFGDVSNRCSMKTRLSLSSPHTSKKLRTSFSISYIDQNISVWMFL